MSLHYVDPIVYTQVDASGQSAFLTELRDALLAAGWTHEEDVKARLVITFFGVPFNNETITLNGKTYTYKTTLTGAANEILRGVDAAACASNLNDAINDISANEGTTYGTGTTAHTTLESTLNGAALTISYQTGGVAGNGFTTSNGLSSVGLSSTTGLYGGYKLVSGRTPHNLQMKILLRYAGLLGGGDPSCELVVYDINENVSNSSVAGQILMTTSRLLEVVACPYQLFIWLIGSSSTGGTVFECGIPYLHLEHVPPVIAAVADSGGEYEVETATAHGLVTGNHVYISGATKSGGTVLASLNGDWQVTVVDATHYTLDGSVYESGYDADSAISASLRQISRCIWANGQERNLARNTFRAGLAPFNVSQSFCWVCVNQYSYSHVGAGVITALATPRKPNDGGSVAPPKMFGGRALFIEPRIGWPATASSSTFFWMGELWNALVVCDDIAMDTLRNDFDGHNWISYTDNSNEGTLCLATATLP